MADNDDNSKRTTIFQLEKGILKRVLGVFDLFAIGYGDLGSSIFYALGVTALYALGATPIALGLAGLVFICTALTYAEMTAAFHESGGSASFARHAFNDLISFIAGWGLLLDYIVTIAISAFAVGPYLGYFFAPLQHPPVQICFAGSLIAILLIMNILGIKQSTRISLVLTVFTVLVQAVVIAIGFSTLLDLTYVAEHVQVNVPDVSWSPTWKDFWIGTAMAMVAYTGIESIAQLAAEAQRPGRTVPRAIVLTMVVLIVVYLGISLVALSAISPHELGTKYLTNPIAAIVDALPFGGKILSPCIAVIAAIVLSIAANAGLIGSSRLAFNMGQYYQLPRFFHRLNARFRTPAIALTFFSCVAGFIVLASRGKMDFLADLYNFGAMLAFFFAHLSLIAMRIRKPRLRRTFKIPFNIRFKNFDLPISAIIGCLATFSVWCLVVITKPYGRYLGCAWMLFGLTMYFYFRRARKMQPTGHVSVEQIKVPDYQPLSIQRILVPIRGEMSTETLQIACEMAKAHRAQISVISVLDIPSSLPLDTEMPYRVSVAEAVLRKMEAISRELNIESEFKIIRSRSVSDTILDLLKKGKYDLVVVGASRHNKGLGPVVEKLLRDSPCRVWVCSNQPTSCLVIPNDRL